MPPSPIKTYTPSPHSWLTPEGKPLACEEKEKVLNENLEEIRNLCQDALEDALLMGCDEANVRAIFQRMITELENPFLP